MCLTFPQEAHIGHIFLVAEAVFNSSAGRKREEAGQQHGFYEAMGNNPIFFWEAQGIPHVVLEGSLHLYGQARRRHG